MFHRIATSLTLLALLSTPMACGKDDVKLAPKAEKLEEATPKTETATQWAVQSADSKVTFDMQAPFERQDGEVPESALSGTLHLDLKDLSKSTGLIAVDISNLEIYMQKAEKEGEYGERTKDATQNEHMRDWLEVGEDAPPQELEKNQRVQFSLAEVTEVSTADVTAMSGADRTVTFTAKGEFLLHQHKAPKTVKLEATFHFEGDTPKSVDVKTQSPFAVALPEHDVRPRTGFGALAKKTLGALADKVGEEAQVSVAFSATPAAT